MAESQDTKEIIEALKGIQKELWGIRSFANVDMSHLSKPAADVNNCFEKDYKHVEVLKESFNSTLPHLSSIDSSLKSIAISLNLLTKYLEPKD